MSHTTPAPDPATAAPSPYLSHADDRVWELRYWNPDETTGSVLYRDPLAALHRLACLIRPRWDRIVGTRPFGDVIPATPPTEDLAATNSYFVAQPNSREGYWLVLRLLDRLPQSLRDLPVDETRVPDPGPEFALGNVGGDWICVCGNDPSTDGFETCAPDGREVSPYADGPWDGLHYLCARCGRILIQPSGRVIGRTETRG
ncbi:hypothetical protein [Micromonospora sp. NPDC049662]|uniref:hypothetical protein n=1 Tax=Micromonospora sp. NPDC049662 TaxID=3155397 RepID=UPI003428055F